ncbi:hypothetical protein [Paenibacillus amylolyticus]|uniref:hypothetical protein n=1 Tax=Paenibacillus amylolyticus TaxID=1451 RepID=UPI003D969133
MFYEETLFETIMNLEYRDVPYQWDRKLNNQESAKAINEKKFINLRLTNNSTTDLDTFYHDLVKEGSRLDITIERRMKIREELTLIRKQKQLMDKAMSKQDMHS